MHYSIAQKSFNSFKEVQFVIYNSLIDITSFSVDIILISIQLYLQ